MEALSPAGELNGNRQTAPVRTKGRLRPIVCTGVVCLPKNRLGIKIYRLNRISYRSGASASRFFLLSLWEKEEEPTEMEKKVHLSERVKRSDLISEAPYVHVSARARSVIRLSVTLKGHRLTLISGTRTPRGASTYRGPGVGRDLTLK